MKKYLLVNYFIDAGNIILGKNFKKLFRNEFDFYNFELKKNNRSLLNKLLSAINLRKIVKLNTLKGKKIIFNSLGAATLAFGTYQFNSSILIIDWSRTFQNSIKKKKINKDIIFYFQKFLINRFGKVFSRSIEFKNHLIKEYHLDKNKVDLIEAPIIFELFKSKPKKIKIKKPKLLFIGNDFFRKGGDILLKNKEKLYELYEITIVTKTKIKKSKYYNLIRSVKYGSLEHKNLYKKNDIFFFPTTFDPYGMVIGEAASSGMCIITTKYAFSAKNFIKNNYSGIISKNPATAFEELIKISKNKNKIHSFKKNIYIQTKKNYNFKTIKLNLKKKIF